MKFKMFFLAPFALCLFVTASAQEPNRWHGLTLDQSTTGDAIKVLGSPKADKLSQLSAPPVESWISKKRKEKVFRTLEYKNPVSGVEKAWLTFLNDRLVSVMLDMKEGTVSTERTIEYLWNSFSSRL